MSVSQVCRFRYRNGSKSLRLSIRYYPGDSMSLDEITADFVGILRYSLRVSLEKIKQESGL